MDTWRLAGAAGRSGLLPLESATGERLAVDVRGGVAWPWPVAVGTRMISAGAAVVVGYAPADRRARLLRWRLTGTVGPAFAPDMWPEDGGVVGALRDGAWALGCFRWYALCNAEDQEKSMRTVRREIAGIGAQLRVTAFADQTSTDDVRALLWRWASERRLVPLPPEAVSVIEREEQEPGPRPLTAAIAAALESLERRPWRPAAEERWEPISRNILPRGY